MKFTIDGRDFKKAIDRISVIVAKKSINMLLECIKITAEKDSVKFEVANISGISDTIMFADITSYANVFESGSTYVKLSDLKKVYGITTSDITITANDTFDVRSGRKSYTVGCFTGSKYDDSFPNFPDTSNMEKLVEINTLDIINKLGAIDCMRDDNINNIMLTGFYLDTCKKRLVAIDGKRIGIANLTDCNLYDYEGVIIPAPFYKGLKSLVGKNNYECTIMANNNYVMTKGEDFSYILKRISGKYFNVDGIITYDKDYAYDINPSELGKIAAEYAKIVDKNNLKPMIIYNNGGKLYTSIETDSIKTSDIVDDVDSIFGTEEEFFAGFNPIYISDACKVFDGECRLCGKYHRNVPITLENDSFTTIILPVNINDNDTEYVKKLAC